MKQVHGTSAGRLIKEAREKKGLTQQQLADHVGVIPRTISRWENGDAFPQAYHHAKLSEALGKSLEELGLIRKRTSTGPPLSLSNATLRGIPIIGRGTVIKNILAKLQELSKQHETGKKFLTLVGVPGVGKSTIAQQIETLAKEGGNFPYVCFILLEAVFTVEAAMEVIEKHPVLQHQDQATLLILDNCEKLQGIAVRLYRYLWDHPHITILATSRVTLSDAEYKIEPLAFPHIEETDPTVLLKNETVQLFLAEVNAGRQPDEMFEITKDNAAAVAHFCHAIAGLPLALNIVAPSVRTRGMDWLKHFLNSRQYLFLDSLSPDERGQKTLYQIIVTSYIQFGKDGQTLEQRLLRRLGIFVGRCNIASAIAVCNLNCDLTTSDDPLLDPLLANALNRLDSYNLIIFEDTNFIRIAHATIRDFALETMDEDEQEAIRTQFVDYYNFVLEDCDICFTLRNETQYGSEVWRKYNKDINDNLRLLQDEIENLRSALEEMRKRRKAAIETRLIDLLGEQQYRALSRLSQIRQQEWKRYRERNFENQEGTAFSKLSDEDEKKLDVFEQTQWKVENEGPYPLCDWWYDYWQNGPSEELLISI